MKPRHETTQKRVKRAVVGSARRTVADVQADISESRRGSVYRTDVEFSPYEGSEARTPLTPRQVDETRRLHALHWTAAAIARELQVWVGHVKRVCKQYDRQIVKEEK